MLLMLDSHYAVVFTEQERRIVSPIRVQRLPYHMR